MKTLFVIAVSIVGATEATAEDWSYQNRRNLSADAMRRFGVTETQVGDHYREIHLLNLGASLNLLGDCGNLDFRVSAKSLYDEAGRLFKDLRDAAMGTAQGAINAAPMLALCYFSPTGCSIAKNLQLYASYQAKLRFDQCQAINRYVDSRAGAYKEAQANCMRSHMAKNGNITDAVSTCQGSADKLISWIDGSNGLTSTSNSLVRASAQWAGFNESDGRLLEALVGGVRLDTRGKRSASFGDYEPFTPARWLDTYSKMAFERLCGENGALSRFNESGKMNPSDARYFTSRGRQLVDERLLKALSRLPSLQRESACDRLASSISLARYIDEINFRLDQLYVMAQNPHLPPKEAEGLEKRTEKLATQALAVIKIRAARQEGLNAVRGDIIEAADRVMNRDMERSAAMGTAKRPKHTAFDECEDFVVCNKNSRIRR